jgi:HEPN domain-containing protein
MGVPIDIDARRYYRVAYQRLEDGALMLEKLDRPKPAIYLSGYASECILKALLITATPLRERPEIVRSFRGAIAHDLQWLRERLRACGVFAPMIVAKELAYVATWSVDLRYEPGAGDRDDAQRFIASTRSVLEWADGRM